MYSHLLLLTDADGLRPALQDDRCPARVERADEPCWRSEAFAEDFAGAERAPRLRHPGALSAQSTLQTPLQRPVQRAWLAGALSLLGRGGGLRQA